MSHADVRAESVIAVGGGIGAGKSSVLEVFRRAGFVVIEADKVGHEVLASSEDAGRTVMRRWPSVVVDGEVSRSLLAGIVFEDRTALGELESITHPAIEREIRRRIEEATGRVAIEIPVLTMFADDDWHRIAVVAPEDVRIARAVARGAEPGDVRARLASQPSESAWREWADTVIDNDRSWERTERALDPFVAPDGSL